MLAKYRLNVLVKLTRIPTRSPRSRTSHDRTVQALNQVELTETACPIRTWEFVPTWASQLGPRNPWRQPDCRYQSKVNERSGNETKKQPRRGESGGTPSKGKKQERQSSPGSGKRKSVHVSYNHAPGEICEWGKGEGNTGHNRPWSNVLPV